jgi:membrane protein DedA with SNARE-associated domain
LPLLPEVVACMAGLTKMPAATFFLSLACGSVPVGFVFAWIGAAGRDSPGLAIALSILVPVILYGVAVLVMKRRGRTLPAPDDLPGAK